MRREKAIIENAAFLAAVYVDPRYLCLLKKHQVKVAQRHLQYLAQRVSGLSAVSQPPAVADALTGDEESDDPELADPIEAVLRQHDRQPKPGTSQQDTAEAIKAFANTPRVSKDTDVFQWWQRHHHKQLRQVAETTVSLPVSQASVERTFSGLRYILSEHRLRLSEDVVDAVMTLRCNT